MDVDVDTVVVEGNPLPAQASQAAISAADDDVVGPSYSQGMPIWNAEYSASQTPEQAERRQRLERQRLDREEGQHRRYVTPRERRRQRRQGEVTIGVRFRVRVRKACVSKS